MSSPAPHTKSEGIKATSASPVLTKEQILALGLRLTEFNGIREAMIGFLHRSETEESGVLAEAIGAFQAPAAEILDSADLEMVRVVVTSENRSAIGCLLAALAAKNNSTTAESPEDIFKTLPESAQLEMVLQEAQKIAERFGDAQVLANWYASMPKDQYTWVSMQTPQFQLFYSILTDKARPEWKMQVLGVLGLESLKPVEELN